MKTTQERLKELFTYVDGNLIRLTSQGGVTKGTSAGYLDRDGYVKVNVDGKRYQRNLLVWVYHKGEIPTSLLDHKDGNRSNDRIDNLREVTHLQNQWNRKTQRNSTSRYKGVSWNKRDKRWVSQIRVNGKIKVLGSFKEELKAAKAYDNFAKELHGEYYKPNL